ncbi:MAG: ABC transporter transmembrane domain-containing protein, partial [Planctomycetota bacterium]
MQAFWAFARDMLRYRRLLVLATAAALLDALTAFAGFGLIQGVLRMTFQDQVTLHAALAEFLGRAEVRNVIGDRTAWAAAIPDDMFTGFVIALLAILPLTAFGATMRFTHQAMAITVSLRTVMRVRQRAYFKMLHLPVETPQTAAVPGAGGIPGEGMESADALSRLISDTARLSKGFSTLMGKAPRDVLMGVAFLAWALINDWQLTAIFLLGLPPIGIAIRKFGKRIRRASKYSLRQYAVMIGAAQESMLAPAVVRLHDAEGYERRRFNTINRRVYQQEVRARTARALSSPVIELIALCGLIAVSLVAAWHVFRSASLQPF